MRRIRAELIRGIYNRGVFQKTTNQPSKTPCLVSRKSSVMSSYAVRITGILCCLASCYANSTEVSLPDTTLTNVSSPTEATGFYHPSDVSSMEQDGGGEACELYPIEFHSSGVYLPSQWIRFTCTCGYLLPADTGSRRPLAESCPYISDRDLFRKESTVKLTNISSDSCTLLAELKIISRNVVRKHSPWEIVRVDTVRCKTRKKNITVDLWFKRSANDGHCNEPDDCFNVNQTCISHKCSCPPSKPVFVVSSCYPRAGVGERCQYSQQCNVGLKPLTMFCSREKGMICVQRSSVKPSKKTDAMFTVAIVAVACFTVTVIALFVLFMCNRSVFRRRHQNYLDDVLHRREGDVFSVSDQLARQRLADKPPTYQDVVRNDRMVRGVPPPAYAPDAESEDTQRTTTDQNQHISRLAAQLRRSPANGPHHPSASSSGHQLLYPMARNLTETQANSAGVKSTASGGLVGDGQSNEESYITTARNSTHPSSTRNASGTDEITSEPILGIPLKQGTSHQSVCEAGIPVLHPTLFATSGSEMTNKVTLSSKRFPMCSTQEIDIESSDSQNQKFADSSKVADNNAELLENSNPNVPIADIKDTVVLQVVSISGGAYDNKGYVSES